MFQNLDIETYVQRNVARQPYAAALCLLVGAYVVINFLLELSTFLLTIFVIGGGRIKKYARRDSWAVVTGATDGIGLEFSRQLAKKGMNILLVSRNPEKLGKIAAEIEASSGVSTKTHAIDFSRPPNEKTYQELERICKDIPISILVNNVGRSHEMPVPFAETPQSEMEAIVSINIAATLRITRIVLPEMIKRPGQSLILNIGSFAGLIPTPLLSTYSGAKAFLMHFSRSLAAETKGKVDVKLLNTYYVVSAMSKIRKPSMSTPTPAAYVKAALASIGSSSPGDGIVGAPYWSHAVIEHLIKLWGATDSKLVNLTKGINEDIRRRALRKKARDGEGSKTD